MPKKVLLLSASAGAGHVRAAQAVERALLESKTEHQVHHYDTLEFTTKVFRDFYSKAYIEAVNKAPELVGWIYDQLDKPWKNERRRLAFDKLNTRPFVKLLHEHQPDIVVCTHFLPAEIISWLKAKERLNTRQAIVVTDMDAHAMWLVHHYERYFVAIEETQVYLHKLGIPESKISVTGIPIDPVFSKPKDKLEMRRKHGLKPALPTILVSAGGFGVGPVEALMGALMDLKHPAQVIAICGKNKELPKKLEHRAKSLPANHPVELKIIGFTTEMDELMAASDILLGKPGGLTSSEALARGLVFTIFNPIPGQEERNSDHLLEEGAAIRCNQLLTLPYKIDALLEHPKRLERMKANSLRIARPNAAQDIVSQLDAL